MRTLYSRITENKHCNPKETSGAEEMIAQRIKEIEAKEDKSEKTQKELKYLKEQLE